MTQKQIDAIIVAILLAFGGLWLLGVNRVDNEKPAPIVDYMNLPKNCVASWSDLDTGHVEEKPVPCQDRSNNICIHVLFIEGEFTPYAGPCGKLVAP